jgi:hypothetical protein
VKSETTLGTVHVPDDHACGTLVPRAASASRFGVSTSATTSARAVSMTMRSAFFGVVVGAFFCGAGALEQA